LLVASAASGLVVPRGSLLLTRATGTQRARVASRRLLGGQYRLRVDLVLF